MNKSNRMLSFARTGALALVVTLAACASPEQAPATAEVAVSRNAVENAVTAGAIQHAPAELGAAREKMQRANQALAERDYKLAKDLAIQAQADAKLAQSKANAAKATAASRQASEDVRVLREEVERARTQ